MKNNDKILSVAPMMEWTDRHCRVFHRLMTRRALLYTEMVAAEAIIHGDAARLLRFNSEEHPVAAQIGGSDPALLARAAEVVERFGYDEININVGCPSDRVQSGRFGACLMAEPALVADCVAQMKRAVAIPVTVKCRIGIDDQEPSQALPAFLEAVIAAGVDGVTVHARKAWLKGLSPKENRSVPPLDYPLVHAMKARFPETPMAINGGIETLEATRAHLGVMDGVMIGRAAYHNPFMLAGVDAEIFGEAACTLSRADVLNAMRPYIARQLDEGVRLHSITRHMLGLFAGQPGARRYRQIMTNEAVKPGAGLDVLDRALEAVSGAQRRAA